MKTAQLFLLFLTLSLCSTIQGQSDIQHLMELKSGAKFKVSILTVTDSTLSYLSGDHKGITKLSNIKKVAFINTGFIDRPYSTKNANGSHILELKEGASFSVFIVELNDSAITYSSQGLKGTISHQNIKQLSLKNQRNPLVEKQIYPNQYATFKIRKKSKDTTAVFKPKGIIGFMETGFKFGLIEEDDWTYVGAGIFLDGGVYFPKRKNILLGGSIGIHEYSIYNAAYMPFKLQAKYILYPEKRRSIAANISFGYGLQIADENPIKRGGLTYSCGISYIKSKKPKRANEWNFGFQADHFESIRNIGTWNPSNQIFTSQAVEQFAIARRFYITKKWWFK